MEEALELARAKDTKERMAGVERLHQLLESSRRSLTSAETTALIDCCVDLFKDNNFRVSQGALQALASAAVLSGEYLKLHLNAVVPAVVERLGDGKQAVRDAARRLLLTLMEIKGLATTRLHMNGPINAGQVASGEFGKDDEVGEVANNNDEATTAKINLPECGPCITQILDLIGNGSDDTASTSKRDGLQQLVEISVTNDASIWEKYLNQLLTIVLEVLDCTDPMIRELALSLILEMLKNQKTMMEDSVEIVIEKLLHVTKDSIPKVSNVAEHCLSVVLLQYDPFRCFSVIVPLLVAVDEKTLVVCVDCLTKVVGRLSQDELMVQLRSFLPGHFEAFGNQ